MASLGIRTTNQCGLASGVTHWHFWPKFLSDFHIFDWIERLGFILNLEFTIQYSLFIPIQEWQESHQAWTTDTQREGFFFKNLELLGLGRHFGLKFFEAFVVFSAGLSAPILVLWVPCPCFPLFNHFFYKTTKPLYPTPKYLFGSAQIFIWEWDLNLDSKEFEI